MVKRSKLLVEYEIDFRILGLISSTKEYRLAWSINQELNIQLVKQKDHELTFKNGQRLVATHYSVEQDDTLLYSVLKNKAVEWEGVAKPYLVPEHKNYDYLFLVYNDPEEERWNDLVSALNTINVIQYCKEIPITELRSKDNLIL